MNLNEKKYAQFALVQEMMDAVEVVRFFNPKQTHSVAAEINKVGRLLLSGEGSSRLFPAKNLIRQALKIGTDMCIVTDGSHQAAQYNLEKFAVFCASNSGRTKETVLLAKKIAALGNPHRYALTANRDTLLEKECVKTFVLQCGWERAVAATKSVVEQALFYQSILWHLTGEDGETKLPELASCIQQALTMNIDPDIIKTAIQASTIYFAGYNDGVAEELTLKTNEITRRKSDFLEGTYAVHGIEEVMEANDIVFIIDPIDDEIEKLQQVLGEGVGLKLFAIADRDTPLPTLRVPGAGELTPFVYLCAGWNLLVDIGLALGIDLDKPERARKVGNEFVQEKIKI
ncbi:sugar isomerase [candidate division KSB1 bacterium]|nr:sugar isomerase [candidate division KSB1 bacterium]RQW02549.1 MAG: sugar isomerase [candidate division KSB1 bacterium]